MKTTNILLLATITHLAPCLPVATHAATQVYDLNADWSDTQNPNGPWAYREGNNLLQADGYGGWTVGLISVSKQDGNVTVFARCCANGNANILWTAPSAGAIDISGAVWAAEFCQGGSSFWALSHNSNSVSGGQFTCGEYSYFSTGSGGSAVLQNIPVAAGDQVVLEIGYGFAHSGVNFTITLTEDAGDPSAAIQQLAATVVTMNLQNGITGSLDTKLDTALDALDDANAHNNAAAYNSLQAFINAVEAQRGKKITSAQADQLIATARQIQALLQ